MYHPYSVIIHYLTCYGSYVINILPVVFIWSYSSLVFMRKIFQIVTLTMCLFKVFEEPEDPSSRSFFSEIISSISDVKFSHSGRYMMTRDYLSVKVWDLNMENRPVETYQVHKHIGLVTSNVTKIIKCS